MKTQSILCIIYLLSLYFMGCLGDFIHAKYKHQANKNRILPRRYMAEVSNHDRFLQDMKSYDIKIHRTIRHRFLNSISFEINHSNKEREYSTLRSILDHENVENVTPVHIYKRSEITNENLVKKSPEEVGYRSTHRLLQIDKVHRELNLTGEGVFIAIIDTGVDYLHPALGGGYGPGFKVQKGYDFVGKKYDSDENSVPQPDDDPYDDCTLDNGGDGHGTATIGIIGGYDPANNFTGVAPNAKFGVYRILGCQGDTTLDIILEAVTKAVDDGADIINLSIGSSIPWTASEGFASKFFAQIREKGTVVVAAMGNEGDYGIYTPSDPGVESSVISVGGTYNEYTIYDGSFTVTGMSHLIDYKLLSVNSNGTKIYMIDGDLTPSFNGTAKQSEDACNVENISPNVKGRIALVKRGTCSFDNKTENLALAGAIGIIQYDFSPPFNDGNLVINSTIPFAFISFDDGEELIKVCQNSTVSVKFSTDRSTIYKKNPFSGIATSYTGLGPSAELNLKPDFLAVAEDVYTLAPRYMGGWTLFDGTSASVPLVSGSVALYLQHMKEKKMPVKTIAEQFQNYASARNADGVNAIDNPIRIGAGIIQVYDSIVQTTHISPGQISFNDTSSQEYKTHNLTITNNGQNPVSYRVFNNASIAISPYNREEYGYFLIGVPKTKTADASLGFSITEIHLAAGQSQTLTVTVIPPNTNPLDHIIYGGFVQFDPIINNTATTDKPLHVPYFGVVGKQYDLPIVDIDFKQEVSQTVNNTDVKVDEYILDFTKNKTDLIIGFMTLTPTKILRREIFSDQNCTQFFGYASFDQVFNQQYDVDPWYYTFYGEYMETIPTDPFADNSNFTYSKQPIPSGQYYLRQKLLKIFGDMNKENDWEYVKTGPIVIKRENVLYAYIAAKPNKATLCFIPGFKSDFITSKKSNVVYQYALNHGLGFLSWNHNEKGSVMDWYHDGLTLIQHLKVNQHYYVGASMGLWISLLLAPKTLPKGILSIGGGVDFTERWLMNEVPQEERNNPNYVWKRPSTYSNTGYYEIPVSFMFNSRPALIMSKPIDNIACPVHLIHGTLDHDIPIDTANALYHHLSSSLSNVTFDQIEDGDHQLSRPQDLDFITFKINQMMK